MLFLSTYAYAEDYKTYTGDITLFNKGATRLYQFRGITIGRGGVKYVSRYVGQKVKMVCYIKNNKIVKIKSVEPLGKGTDKSQSLTITELFKLYQNSRSSTIKKYRDRPITIQAEVTSISVKSAQQYQLQLNGVYGRIHVDKFQLPAELRKALFALNEKKGGKRNLRFTGKWYGNQGSTLLFKDVTAWK